MPKTPQDDDDLCGPAMDTGDGPDPELEFPSAPFEPPQPIPPDWKTFADDDYSGPNLKRERYYGFSDGSTLYAGPTNEGFATEAEAIEYLKTVEGEADINTDPESLGDESAICLLTAEAYVSRLQEIAGAHNFGDFDPEEPAA